MRNIHVVLFSKEDCTWVRKTSSVFHRLEVLGKGKTEEERMMVMDGGSVRIRRVSRTG